MKNSLVKFTVLKLSYALIFCLSLGVLVSCNNEDDVTENNGQEDMVAEAIINAISPESGGALTQTDEAAAKAAANSDMGKNLDIPIYSCGEIYGDSVTLTGTHSSLSYSLTAQWNWMLNCTLLDVPESFDMNFDYNRQYEGTRMASNDTATGDISATGLQLTSSFVLLNADINYSGSQVSYVRNNGALTSTIDFIVSDLTYSKTTLEITSGTIVVAFSGTYNGEESLVYGGEIEFLGNQSATLHLNNGNSYDFSW